LKEFTLHSNKLETVDLTPLRHCTNLEILRLAFNQFQAIDLTPLNSCINLKTLILNWTPLQSIDVTPLFSNPFVGRDDKCKEHSWLKRWQAVYERPSKTYPWSFLYQVVVKEGKDLRVQQDILVALGLGDYGFIDCNLEELFLSFPPDAPIETVREQVTKVLVDEIVTDVEKGGVTTSLRLEKLVERHGEIAAYAPQIIEIRRSELESITISLRPLDSHVDLQELCSLVMGMRY
jgi:hypothetical protein